MDFSYFESFKGAKNIIEVCACIKKNEELLIITDTNKLQVAQLIALAAQNKEISYSIAVMPVRNPGEEPSPPIIEAMKKADIIITPTTHSLYHSHAILAAREKGARVIALSGVLLETLASPATQFDFRSFRPIVERVASIYQGGNKIKVTSPSGTKIEATIKGRRINVDGGICDKPGQAIGIPIMEVNTTPIEDSTNGRIVVDASMSFFGILRDNISMEVVNGRITKITGGEEARKLTEILKNQKDNNVYTIAEIAIGLNPKAEIKGILAEDEGVLGTMHFGIGNNITLGGKNKANLHIDVIINRPTIWIDDTLLTKEGDLQI